jgi:transcriptional regulator with XRE-family HTH domain
MTNTRLENLRKARQAKGMTVKQLAAEVGLTRAGMWDIEAGRNFGSVPVWDRLEAFFGIDQKVLRGKVKS